MTEFGSTAQCPPFSTWPRHIVPLTEGGGVIEISSAMLFFSQASEHAAARTQFGKHIHQFGAIQEKLAQMSVLHYATESMAYTVAGSGCALFVSF